MSAPIDDLALSNAWVPAGAIVSFDGQLESASGGIVVAGRVRAPWEGICRRCAEIARGELDVEVRELASEDPDPELTYALSRDWLDLEPIAHDACILDLPLAPLCRADCQGLCPHCGANRNSEICTCAELADPRWGPLTVLHGGGAAEAELLSDDQTGAAPEAAPDEDEPG